MSFWSSLFAPSFGATPQPASNADMFARISMANAGTDLVLPGFGPQVPAGNVGTVTTAIPGSVFDTGFAIAQMDAVDRELAGTAGARTTTDLNAWPFSLPDLDMAPITKKLGDLWDSWTGSLNKPAVSVDQNHGAPDGKTIAMVAAVGTAAAVAFLALSKRHA